MMPFVSAMMNSTSLSAPSAYPSTLALLLKMEGSDGASVFTDSSPNPKTITNVNATTTSTARYKEGSSSALYLSDGTGGLSSPDHADFDFGSNTLTVSAWVYKTNSAWGHVIGQRDGDPCWALGHDSAGKAEWLCNTTGTQVNITGGRAITNEWAHLAISKNASGVWRLRQNGKIVASVTNTSPVTTITHVLRLFRTNAGGTNLPMTGNIDLAMVVNGVDLYDTADPVLMPTAINATPQFFIAPKIDASGGRAVGNTLTCSGGLAWPNAGSYTYQWKLAGTPISGATSSSYTIQSGDDVTTLSCTVSNGAASETAILGHRYWRIYVTAINGGAACGISEIEMMRKTSQGNECGSGTASASTEWSGSDAAAEAFNGTFGSGSDAWASQNGAAMPQWIRYDFGSGTSPDITSVNIHARGSVDTGQAPKDFSIQWSDDGSSWTTAWSVTNSTGWSAFERRTFTKP